MISLTRHVRGLGIAIAVLGISAGAVFAGVVPSAMHPASSHANLAAEESSTAEPTESREPTETPEPTDSPKSTNAPAAAAETANPDTHGALVSAAAQMPTPSGFRNHGAFVSCVAHLGTTLATINWATVTPASCGVTNHGKDPSGNGATHGNAGKAKGQANRAAHAPAH
jgi:hypothetical protein